MTALLHTTVYRQHQENTLLHSTPGPGAAFKHILSTYIKAWYEIPSQFSVMHFLFSAILTFYAQSSRAVLNADMMIISKHKRHRNDPKHHHLSHLCKTILHHCNSFMSAHCVRRQLSCGRWEETILTRRQDMGTSLQGFLLSYLDSFLGAFQDFSGLSDLRYCPLKIGC